MPDDETEIDEIIDQINNNSEQTFQYYKIFIIYSYFMILIFFIAHFILEISIGSGTSLATALNKSVFEKYCNVDEDNPNIV